MSQSFAWFIQDYSWASIIDDYVHSLPKSLKSLLNSLKTSALSLLVLFCSNPFFMKTSTLAFVKIAINSELVHFAPFPNFSDLFIKISLVVQI